MPPTDTGEAPGLIPTDAQLAGFLARMRNAVLATVAADGSPQVTPVWYHWDGTVMRISTTTGARKVRNVRRNERVAVCVDDPLSGTYVTLFGVAELIEGDRDLVRQETWPILLRYMHQDEAVARWARIDAEGDRVVLVVTPKKVIWRNGVGLSDMPASNRPGRASCRSKV